MELLLVLLAILVVFGLAALRWGKDSRDTLDNRVKDALRTKHREHY
jgi:hypothetical protein